MNLFSTWPQEALVRYGLALHLYIRKVSDDSSIDTSFLQELLDSINAEIKSRAASFSFPAHVASSSKVRPLQNSEIKYDAWGQKVGNWYAAPVSAISPDYE